MSILYDAGQDAIANESRRILDARFQKDRLLSSLEELGRCDDQFWSTAVEQGWSAMAIPEEYGGLGLGLVELGLVAQAAGAATSGAPFLTVGHGAAVAIECCEFTDLKKEWLPRLGAGNALATVAFAEMASPLPVSPLVTFTDGRLRGIKDGVTAGLKADIALVWALYDGAPALVLAELGGVARNPVNSFDNSRLFADLVFEETPGTLLASGKRARELALDVLCRMAVVTAHEQVGGARELLKIARDYAVTRKAFGQPIGAFQSVKHRIAEMYGLTEIAQANCIHAAAMVDQPGFLIAAADARLSATEAYDTAARDCVQIHGGIGVTWEQGLHLHMRRARTLAIEQGHMLFWEDLLVEQLTGEVE